MEIIADYYYTILKAKINTFVTDIISLITLIKNIIMIDPYHNKHDLNITGVIIICFIFLLLFLCQN